MTNAPLRALEFYAEAGRQSLGFEKAGFGREHAVEIDRDAAATLRAKRPDWNVHKGDVRDIDGKTFRGIDPLVGGIPCPPFSFAGHQLGAEDERDLFPGALRLVREARPSAVMLENVRGLASGRFTVSRQSILTELERLKNTTDWQLLFSSESGVSQLRPRFIPVAFRGAKMKTLHRPSAVGSPRLVGETLHPLMAANGWEGADAWARGAAGIAPTIVGGSKKHRGADFGPTRAKKAWLELHVDGRGVADEAPTAEHPLDHIPKPTKLMVARIQGFDADWQFTSRKTAVYRQIGIAFPAHVAERVGTSIRTALGATATRKPSLSIVA